MATPAEDARRKRIAIALVALAIVLQRRTGV
jgi:hypothetical protein